MWANYCTKCKDNLVIVDFDDHSECKDLATQEYYFDNQILKYKTCSYKVSGCQKCSMDNSNNIFKCLECQDNYALIHGDSEPFCQLKTSLQKINIIPTMKRIIILVVITITTKL